MSIVAGEMRNPEKNVPRYSRFYQYCICSLHVDHRWNNRHAWWSHYANWCTGTRRICRNDWPIGAHSFLGALISIAGLNIGESIMVPRFGAALATKKLLPEGLGKTNSKNAPVIAIIILWYLRFLLLLSGSFESLATFSVVFRFFQYIPTALAAIKLRKMYPDKKVTFRVPFGPVIPVLAVVVSILMIAGDNMMNFV